MGKFEIFELEIFWEKYNKLPKVEQERIGSFISQLEEKGDIVGKPLGRPFFREKKFNGNRLYFLVYEG